MNIENPNKNQENENNISFRFSSPEEYVTEIAKTIKDLDSANDLDYQGRLIVKLKNLRREMNALTELKNKAVSAAQEKIDEADKFATGNVDKIQRTQDDMDFRQDIRS